MYPVVPPQVPSGETVRDEEEEGTGAGLGELVCAGWAGIVGAGESVGSGGLGVTGVGNGSARTGPLGILPLIGDRCGPAMRMAARTLASETGGKMVSFG